MILYGGCRVGSQTEKLFFLERSNFRIITHDASGANDVIVNVRKWDAEVSKTL